MEMTNEEAACQFHAVLMEPEPEPVSRLRTKYHSLRRQVYLIQSISVLFCFSCCLFTLLYHAFPPTCKENGTKEAPTFGMQHQGAESHSRNETIQSQRNTFTSFTRLTVKDNGMFTKKGYVPWMYTPEYPSPDHTRYFILDDDNESLKVLHDGTYKVSLQITYRKLSENLEEISLQHDIHLYTDAYARHLCLLSHWETVNLTYWRKSLFSEGIFSLKSGDRLKVWSENLDLIDVGGIISQKTAFVAYPHFSK